MIFVVFVNLLIRELHSPTVVLPRMAAQQRSLSRSHPSLPLSVPWVIPIQVPQFQLQAFAIRSRLWVPPKSSMKGRQTPSSSSTRMEVRFHLA